MDGIIAATGWELLRGADAFLVEIAAGRNLLRHWTRLCLGMTASLQTATFLRPVLERKSGEPLFASGKKSFLEHMGDIFD